MVNSEFHLRHTAVEQARKSLATCQRRIELLELHIEQAEELDLAVCQRHMYAQWSRWKRELTAERQRRRADTERLATLECHLKALRHRQHFPQKLPGDLMVSIVTRVGYRGAYRAAAVNTAMHPN